MFATTKTEKLYLWLIKIPIFLIPLLPLYISSSMMFPFITGKNFAFRILVEFATALWLGLIAVKKEYRIHNSAIVLSVLIFTFIVGLADLLGVNPYNSFWSNFERMEGYITILHLAIYFMIVTSIFKTKKDWKMFFSIILLVSAFVSLFPFVFTLSDNSLAFRRHIMEYGTREFSTIGNPPFLASYLLITSFIGLILTFHTKKTYLKIVYLMAVILNCVVIYLTATRGVILSAFAGVIIFISVSAFGTAKKSGFKIVKRILLLLFVITIVTSVILWIFTNTEIIKHDQALSRFASMLSSDSVKSRLEVWGMAWNGIKERPILGWGQDNFIGIYTVNPITSMETHIWMDRAHNIVIEWLVNAGILGLFSYLAIFGSAFYILKKADRKKVLSRNELVIIFTALVVYFIQNLFTFDTINTYIIFFALLAYIDNLAFDEKQSHSGSKNSVDLKKIKVILMSATLAALVCFSFIYYFINFKPIRQSRQIIRISFSSPKDDSYSVLLKEFKNTLSFNTLGDSDVRKSMLAVSNQIIKMQHFDQKGALEFIQATVKEVRKEIAINSYNLEYMTDAINFFNKLAVYEQSFIAWSEALIKKTMLTNPEFKRLNMLMADVYILKKEYNSAFTNVKEIVGQNPENEVNQFKLALMAVYAAKEDEVKKALENVKNIRISKDRNIISESTSFLTLVELQQLAQVYKEMKRYTIALQYLEEIINIVSEEKIYFDRDIRFYLPETKARMRAQIHVEIARMYLKLDDRETALKEVEKAEKIDPDLSDYIKNFIDSINN